MTRAPLDTPSRALVVGGGIAGLLAARVLADHYERVTILERDRFAERPQRRPGVPQAAHQHVLLLRGLHALERFFPGIRAELIAAGVPVVDMARDVAWLTAAGWGIRFPSELQMLACSRELLEWTIRRRLGTVSNVALAGGSEVTGLRLAGERVAAVRCRARGGAGPGQAEHDEPAELVVDASGRHSRLPDWLEQAGFPRPREVVVDGLLGYASRIYRLLPDSGRHDWTGAYVQSAPPRHLRGGLVLPVEGGRWHVTLAGAGGDYPPTDERGFLEFARSLRDSIVYDAIRRAEPLTPIAGFRATENRWRRYDELAGRPHGLLSLGDAVCAFNPVYAQGMTAAARATEALAAVLAAGTADVVRRFDRALARVYASCWQLATGEDLRLPQAVGGRRNLGLRLLHAYMDRVTQLTTTRRDVRLAFLRTMHMLDEPTALFRPAILWAVARTMVAPPSRPTTIDLPGDDDAPTVTLRLPAVPGGAAARGGGHHHRR
jgi:2-polyprenyl-6-methoxyphenol hydroxylase-like FAD-dependent oxidoreductase